MGVKIDIEYLGGFKTRAVHGPSGTVLHTAAPVDNQGDGSSFSPTDLAATSLATCALTILAMAARKHGVELKGATAQVEKEMSAELPRRIVRLPITLTLPPGVPREIRERLEDAARNCPVYKSIHPEIESDIRFVWPD